MFLSSRQLLGHFVITSDQSHPNNMKLSKYDPEEPPGSEVGVL